MNKFTGINATNKLASLVLNRIGTKEDLTAELTADEIKDIHNDVVDPIPSIVFKIGSLENVEWGTIQDDPDHALKLHVSNFSDHLSNKDKNIFGNNKEYVLNALNNLDPVYVKVSIGNIRYTSGIGQDQEDINSYISIHEGSVFYDIEFNVAQLDRFQLESLEMTINVSNYALKGTNGTIAEDKYQSSYTFSIGFE